MVVGSDAHGGVRLGSRITVPVPSYSALFRLAQNHVLLDELLTGDAARDAAAIVSSLGRGRAYVALDALASGGGFFFMPTAAASDGKWAIRLRCRHRRCFVREVACLRAPALILRRNGEMISQNVETLSWPVTAPGVYRVEVNAPGWTVPWVVSNPIYVFDLPDQEARRTRSLVPVRGVTPPKLMVEDFASTSSFEPASDASTVVDRNVIDVKGGVAGSRAARLAFELSPPTAEIPSPFAALVRLGPHDLSGSLGLTFMVRSDRGTASGSRCATKIRGRPTALNGGTPRSEAPRVAAHRDPVSAVPDARSSIRWQVRSRQGARDPVHRRFRCREARNPRRDLDRRRGGVPTGEGEGGRGKW